MHGNGYTMNIPGIAESARASLRRAMCVAVLLAGTLPSCTGEHTPAKRSAVPAPDSLSIFYTCDTRGHINPCNCSAGVAGGLPRRMSFLKQQITGDALIVDAGNLTAGTRPWELLELEYILRGYQKIGYHAANIGRREAGLPLATLKDLARRYPFLVSANITDKQGLRVFPAYHVVTLKGGYRAAIIGVLTNTLLSDEIGEGVAIAPPEEAIAKILPEARAESDLVVLIAFTDEQTMKNLADHFFEISVIVGGDVEQPSGDAVRHNKSTLVYITEKGKSVGRLDLRYVGGNYVAEANVITTLLDNIPDDMEMTALVNEMQQKQVENNYPVKKDDEDGLTSVSGGQ